MGLCINKAENLTCHQFSLKFNEFLLIDNHIKPKPVRTLKDKGELKFINNVKKVYFRNEN